MVLKVNHLVREVRAEGSKGSLEPRCVSSLSPGLNRLAEGAPHTFLLTTLKLAVHKPFYHRVHALTKSFRRLFLPQLEVHEGHRSSRPRGESFIVCQSFQPELLQCAGHVLEDDGASSAFLSAPVDKGSAPISFRTLRRACGAGRRPVFQGSKTALELSHDPLQCLNSGVRGI